MPVDNERPPYVRFEIRPVEDRAASQTNGYYTAKDVAFVIIQRPGDRDTVEKVADEWILDIKSKARQGLIPQEWANAYDVAYKSFKSDEAPPETGTSLKGWPVISPSQVHQLISAGIRTVEDLAHMPDGDISRILMGGMGLKQKAITWLDSAKNIGTVVEQLTATMQKVESMTNTIQQQAEEIAKLRAQLPQPKLAPKV